MKDSFRAYVVGGAAKGRIATSDGATQAAGNGAFTFPGATGSCDTGAGSLSAAFKGAVNFKGHESNGSYGLDLTLADVHATLVKGSGKLTADVTSLGVKSQDVVLADLKAPKPALTAKDDVITVDHVTATLTAAGAKAFGDFYRAGAELDPVDLSIAVTDDAELPDGDDGTNDPGTASSGTTGDTAGGTGGLTATTTGGGTGGPTLAETGSTFPAAALGTAAALTAAAGAGVVLVARRRRTEA
ncbi:HtaA domain-containing protein [Streptomyces sp. NPDC086787]|uniref:HtaA domain-containing protein n=1 Tax=Streptomyces sp. NPDC086787 TaxID=3365759 RepID=UPI003823852A